MSSYDKFFHYLRELLDSYQKLAALLGEKIQAVNSYDIQALEAIVKEEQAYVLLSKGFEANLAGHRAGLGLEGNTLREVVDSLPGEWQGKFRPLAAELRAVVDTVQALNGKCQSLLQAELYALDKSIQELDRSNPGLYNRAAASAQNQGRHILTKSV